MAKTQNAIKILQKAGAQISQHPHVRAWTVAQFPAAQIIVNDQDGEVSSLYVIRNGRRDDIQSDYFAGTYEPSTKAAIELARRMET